jgi:hypothetical protein
MLKNSPLGLSPCATPQLMLNVSPEFLRLEMYPFLPLMQASESLIKYGPKPKNLKQSMMYLCEIESKALRKSMLTTARLVLEKLADFRRFTISMLTSDMFFVVEYDF